MNNIDTHIAMLALDGETRVIGRGQFVVWDDVQEKWMLGTSRSFRISGSPTWWRFVPFLSELNNV